MIFKLFSFLVFHKLLSKYTEKELKHIIRKSKEDPEMAFKAYFIFNGNRLSDFLNYRPAMIRKTVEFGYLNWPVKIANDIRGKDILDVGCGSGIHSIGYILVGAKSYTGMDPKLKLNDDKVKNIRMNNKDNFGWSPRIIENKHSRIKLIPGTFEDISIESSFDLAILHNVTEHLMNIEDVFKGVWKKLKADGQILYHHHNF